MTKYKAHLVSQVLLKRFAIKRQIAVHSLENGTTELLPYKNKGYIELPETLYKKMERKWGYIETRTATAFLSLDRGELLKNPKDVQTIKKLMCLHFIRSFTLYKAIIELEGRYFTEAVIKTLKAAPGSEEIIKKFLPQTRKEWVDDLNKIAIQIFKKMNEVESFIEQRDIVIGIAPGESNFILSDIPAITINKDGKTGMAIDSAEGFALPLGPKHIAALINKNKSTNYEELSSKQVETANNKMIRHSLKEYYHLPET